MNIPDLLMKKSNTILNIISEIIIYGGRVVYEELEENNENNFCFSCSLAFTDYL